MLSQLFVCDALVRVQTLVAPTFEIIICLCMPKSRRKMKEADVRWARNSIRAVHRMTMLTLSF